MDIIKELKENWTAWGGLSDEKREFLKANWDDVEFCLLSDWSSTDERMENIDIEDVYRLRPDFEEKQGRWVEYPIYPDHGVYFCRVDHMNKCGAPKSPEFTLSDLPDFVGFGGVQFEGQDDQRWSMDLTGFWEDYGYVCTVGLDDEKPATPIKARFWV